VIAEKTKKGERTNGRKMGGRKMGVGKNRRGPARAMEEAIASGVQPSPQLPRQNPDRKETTTE